jgi:hypothetical protein
MVMSSLHWWKYLVFERGLLFGGEAQLVDNLDGNLASGHPVFNRTTTSNNLLASKARSAIPYMLLAHINEERKKRDGWLHWLNWERDEWLV